MNLLLLVLKIKEFIYWRIECLVRFAGELSVKSAYTFQQLRFDQCMRLQRLACLLIFPVYIL